MPLIGIDHATGFYIYCFYHRRSNRFYCFLRDPKTGRWNRFLRDIYIAVTCTFESESAERHWTKNIYLEAQVVGVLRWDEYFFHAKSFAEFLDMLWRRADEVSRRCNCCFDEFGLDYEVAGAEYYSEEVEEYCKLERRKVEEGVKEVMREKDYSYVFRGCDYGV